MNGLLAIDAQSGVLLYSRALQPSFGLRATSDDPSLEALRLASSIFAWQVNAASVFPDDQDGHISLYALDDVAIHIHAEPRALLLVVAVTTQQVAHARGLALASTIAGSYVERVGAGAAFSRAAFSTAFHEALGTSLPVAYLRACLEAATPAGPLWAWMVTLGVSVSAEQRAASLESMARAAGEPWPLPPLSSGGWPPRKGLWRVRSAPGSSPAPASRVLGPWHTEAGDDAQPSTREMLPTIANVPTLLRALAQNGAGHRAPAAAFEMALPQGGSCSRALLMRRGSTLLVLGLQAVPPSHRDEDASGVRSRQAVASLRTGELLGELDMLLLSARRPT
ncbi:hypothetical protein T492DRAFT_1085536 [Pavlovales sp. CCMP2436]|nr:hypothetical protein T492DRAFT_1085536 [Pavlovales sp. CCMP2436]|mmetsp:Transcript_12406/g.31385  ORF Transcript_12406/g.31385 Transcript_12406/m.31385 type:complete len:337 (-) Transcript_12406:63-1073(-)